MFRDEDAFEPQFLRLADALLDAVHGTDFARKPDFTSHAHFRFDRGVHVAAEDGADDGKVYGRVVHFQSAGNVEEHILLRQLEADPLLQHRQQHVHAADVESGGGTLRVAIDGTADQRLRLDEERPHPLDCRGDGDAAHALVVLAQQQLGGVAHLPQAVLPHLVDAQFGSASETVLDAPQDAVHVVLVALELEHGVYDVLQHLRSRDASFLIDVPDKDDRRMRLLGEAQDGGGTLAHLCDAARRRFQAFGRNGLYGVDDDDVRADVLDVDVYLLQRGLADDEAVAGVGCQAVGAQLQLAGTLFAGNVKDALLRHTEHGLQGQGGLPDARFATNQHQGARHQPTA